MNKPDFDNLLATLYRQKTKRTPIFEFIINNPSRFKKPMIGYQPKKDKLDPFREYIHLYHNLGYDFVSLPVWEANLLSFPFSSHDEKDSRSLNVDSTIVDRASFENYPWPDPEIGEYEVLEDLAKELPDGMKFILIGNYGVLENAVNLVGFDKLSLMLFEEPDLVTDIFNAIGSRLLRYYEIVAAMPGVGACIGNDDWGFNSSTMFSPDTLREHVFPWHKRIVETVHNNEKPIILHSCGNLDNVMDDIIDDMKYDGKHSFQDNILPVEDAYEKWGDRIAIIGGMDMHYLVNSSPQEIIERSQKMVNRSIEKGAYALGSGNSIPEYIPLENFYAMNSVIAETLY